MQQQPGLWRVFLPLVPWAVILLVILLVIAAIVCLVIRFVVKR